MEIEPPRQATQKEDTTAEFEAGMQPMAHRRTVVTVERETVSVLIRRPAAGPANQPPDEDLPAVRNEPNGGKP